MGLAAAPEGEAGDGGKIAAGLEGVAQLPERVLTLAAHHVVGVTQGLVGVQGGVSAAEHDRQSQRAHAVGDAKSLDGVAGLDRHADQILRPPPARG